MATGPYLSIITLNVNGLNAPTKRQRLAEWIQKQDPYICCLQETHIKTRNTYRLKVKCWKKIFHANWVQKKAGVARLISDKIEFQIKAVKRDKEGHYIMIKGSIQEEDITIINIYAPNIGAPQYVRQILSMKEEINSNTMIVGDFNTPLTTMDRSTKQKINKETQTLNDTMDQLDLIDIYRTFHPKTINFTFSSSAPSRFLKPMFLNPFSPDVQLPHHPGVYTWGLHVSNLGFPGGSDGKKSAFNAVDPCSVPALGRSLGEGNGDPLQYSCLENPMDRGAWRTTVQGVAKSQTWLSSRH